ncbi:uncharacterized protein METZ01_LOCUS201210, partial [marine metagenome]
LLSIFMNLKKFIASILTTIWSTT